MISIGGLSKRTGVHIETIRYYERQGVLPKARRGENGRRVYGEDDVARLLFARSARDLGFDLPAVTSLLRLQEDPDRTCAEASALAAGQLEAIERKIERMLAVRNALRRMCGCANASVDTCATIKGIVGVARRA